MHSHRGDNSSKCLSMCRLPCKGCSERGYPSLLQLTYSTEQVRSSTFYPEWSTIVAKRQATNHSPQHNAQSYIDTRTHHSLRQLFDGFTLSYRLDGKSPLTIYDHEYKLKRFLDYLQRHQLPEDIGAISVHHIRSFLGYVRDTYRLDAATVQRYLVALKAFWRWAGYRYGVQTGAVVVEPQSQQRPTCSRISIAPGIIPSTG